MEEYIILNKKGLIIILILSIIFISISSVSADDINVLEEESNNYTTSHLEKLSDEPLKLASTGTFTELQNLINSNSVVSLNKDYKYNPNTDYNLQNTGIVIDKSITINGNQHTIEKDLKYSPVILNIKSGNTVTLNSLNFKYSDNYYHNNEGQIGEMISNVGTLIVKNSVFYGQSDLDFTLVGAIHNAKIAHIVNSNFYNFYETISNNGNLNNGNLLNVTNCRITGSNATGIANFRGKIVISSSTFSNNAQPIFNERGTINIYNSIFTNNYNNISGFGGAIYQTNATITIQNSKFTNNYASTNGGAIYTADGSTLIIQNTQFSNNKALVYGSAIYNSESKLQIQNSNFTNHQGEESTIHLYNCYPYKTVISNCNIKNNYNEFAIDNFGGYLEVFNSNLTNNDGGIYARSRGYAATNIVQNCIISNNREYGILNGYTSGDTVTNITHSIITENKIGLRNSGVNSYVSYPENIINANYNVICNTLDISNDEENTGKGIVNAQYNWWGSNKGNINSNGNNINSEKYIKLYVNSTYLGSNENEINLMFLDNNYNYLNDFIPACNIIYTQNCKGNFTKKADLLLSTAYSLFNAENNGTIYVKVNNQGFNVNIAGGETPHPILKTVYVSPNGKGNGSLSSPMGLKEGINSLIYGGTVYLLDGIYKLNEPLIITNNEINLKGYNGSPILDGNNKLGILNISNDSTVNIYGINIVNANTKNSGAIKIFDSTVRFFRCNITNNTGDSRYLIQSQNSIVNIIDSSIFNNLDNSNSLIWSYESFISLVNSSIINNPSQNIESYIVESTGGHVYIDESIFTNNRDVICTYKTSVFIFNSIFKNSSSKYGIVICDYTGKFIALSNCTFINNSGITPIYLESNLDSDSYIRNCTFINNSGFNGGAIYIYSSNITINSSKFIDNTASSKGGAICTLDGSNVRVEGSCFINNSAQESGNNVYSDNPNNILNYNWWGTNNPDFKSLNNGLVDTNPLILTGRFKNDTITVGLYPNGIKSNILSNIDLTTFDLEFNADNGILTPKHTITNKNGEAISKYTTNKTDDYITVSLYAYSIQIPVNGSSIDEIDTYLEVENLVKIFGTDTPFKASILCSNSSPVVGHYVALKLTRLSNGQSKVYNVVSDYLGEITLPINLGVGIYSVELEYPGVRVGNKTFFSSFANATISVTKEEDDRIVTILTSHKFDEPYGAGKSFTGNLNDINDNLIIGHHVNVKLTRLSSGASKTYDCVVDYTGTFYLTINLATGNYLAECTYTGTSKYQSSSSSNTITIY